MTWEQNVVVVIIVLGAVTDPELPKLLLLGFGCESRGVWDAEALHEPRTRPGDVPATIPLARRPWQAAGQVARRSGFGVITGPSICPTTSRPSRNRPQAGDTEDLSLVLRQLIFLSETCRVRDEGNGPVESLRIRWL